MVNSERDRRGLMRAIDEKLAEELNLLLCPILPRNRDSNLLD